MIKKPARSQTGAAHNQHVKRELIAAVGKLESYIHGQGYAGYDPYDALKSPLFKLPVLRSNRFLRISSQQLLRRFPLNVRPMLGIRKGYSPVTLGLCLQGYSYLKGVFPKNQAEYTRRMKYCINELDRVQTKGYSGACWGYEFDWEARYARMPARTPTVVATGMVTNALFEHYTLTGSPKALALCRSAVEFVRRDLRRTYIADAFCYSYSPRDSQLVLNATMKGARLLAQVYSITGAQALMHEALQTVRFVVACQEPSGAWPYALAEKQMWTDNFHTAYILDCLHEIIKISGATEFHEALDRGRKFYFDNFFEPDGAPRYFPSEPHPVDATAAAQSIITLTRFGYYEQATRVAGWVIRNLQDRRGFIYYQKRRWYTNRIPYMRWSNAWMFAALSYLLKKTHALV